MRKFISLLFAIGLVITACQETTSIVEPENEEITLGLNKEWISLPEKDPKFATVETQFTRSKRIYRWKGGRILFRTGYRMRYYTGYSGDLDIAARLIVPPYAFHDKRSKVFSITLDTETCSATFEPSPFEFDRPLQFDFKYKNLDLSKFNLDTIDFAYIAKDGHKEKAKYDKIVFDIANGILEVYNAKIPHFSRFGFVN